MTQSFYQETIRRSARARVRRRTAFQSLVDSLEGRMMLDVGGSSASSFAIDVGDRHPARAEVGGERIVLSQPLDPALFPEYVVAGSPFAFTATIEDAREQVLTKFNHTLSIALTSNPGGAILGGMLTATVSGGVATFSGLTLSQPGTGYVLQVSGAGLEAATVPFDVWPDTIVFAGGPKIVPAVISTQGVTKDGAIDKIVLGFDDSMNRASLTDLRNYSVLDLGTDPQYPDPTGRRVRLIRADDDAATDSVTLRLQKLVGRNDSLWVSLNGLPPSGLRDADGLFLEDGLNPYSVTSTELSYLPNIE